MEPPRDSGTMTANGHKPKCSATNRTGERCGNYARMGMTVCSKHGGMAPQVIDAADRRLQQEQVARLADMLGVPVEVDPQTALLEELYRTAGLVAWLEHQVRNAGGNRMFTFTLTGERPSALVDMWQKERDRLVKVAAECARAGVEERKVAIVEEHGRVMSQLLRAVLADSELGVTVSVEVQSMVVRKHLGLLSKGELVA